MQRRRVGCCRLRKENHNNERNEILTFSIMNAKGAYGKSVVQFQPPTEGKHFENIKTPPVLPAEKCPLQGKKMQNVSGHPHLLRCPRLISWERPSQPGGRAGSWAMRTHTAVPRSEQKVRPLLPDDLPAGPVCPTAAVLLPALGQHRALFLPPAAEEAK